jgi:hypothetical protein
MLFLYLFVVFVVVANKQTRYLVLNLYFERDRINKNSRQVV